MRADAECHSCHAPIRWAIHAVTGRRMPLNPEANPRGNIGIVEFVECDGATRLPLAIPKVVINPKAEATVTPYRYTTHFATCPEANAHRRRS